MSRSGGSGSEAPRRGRADGMRAPMARSAARDKPVDAARAALPADDEGCSRWNLTRMRRREATLEDLAREPGKAELVSGRIVRMSPTGGLPGYAGREIVVSLREYSRRTGTGHAIPDNVAFTVTLPHRRSFAPDAAFYVGALGMGFLAGAPRFAVEVRSEGDYGPAAERRLASKRADYFAAGTLVVWDVDLLATDVVRVYRAHEPEQPAVYRRSAGTIAPTPQMKKRRLRSASPSTQRRATSSRSRPPGTCSKRKAACSRAMASSSVR